MWYARIGIEDIEENKGKLLSVLAKNCNMDPRKIKNFVPSI